MKSVLLVGGTSETGAIAQSLAAAGHSVLVCTATDMPLDTGDHPSIRRRCGRLTADAFAALIHDSQIDIVVNAAHPFATAVRDATRAAASRCRVPHIEFMRPDSALPDSPSGILYAADHREAAQRAVAAGQTILLTIGVNHLAPYVDAARASGRKLVARVLPRDDSVAACRAAGLRDDQIVVSRGVPGVADTVAVIRKHGIQVLVTKDSGAAGGVPDKCEAARQAGCVAVVVRRPPVDTAECARSIPALVQRVADAVRAPA